METYRSWRTHRTIRLGAGLAYYGLFAIVPLMLLIIAIAGKLFSQPDVQSTVNDANNRLVGHDAAELAQEVAQQLDSAQVAAGLGVIGAVSLLITGSLAFLALQDALNVIWQQPVLHGWAQTVRRRGLALGVVFMAAAFAIFAAAILAFANLIDAIVPNNVVVLESLTRALGSILVLALAAGTLALLFRLLVYAPPSWRHALIGAGITILVMVAGSWLMGAYLVGLGSSSLAGAAGAAVLLLTWIYVEAQILLAGAELTRVLSQGGGFHTDEVNVTSTGSGSTDPERAPADGVSSAPSRPVQ